MVCVVCGADDYEGLHPVNINMVSDGTILPGKLNKRQCSSCGLVSLQDIYSSEQLDELYSNGYKLYANRPGAESFSQARIDTLISIFNENVHREVTQSILEVGCGIGSFLEPMKEQYNAEYCIGLEPAFDAIEKGREYSWNVVQGSIGEDTPEIITRQKYDLIYSFHVIEHVNDPVQWLESIKPLMNPDADLIVSCPNSELGSTELLRADHVHSFLPKHLVTLFSRAGLEVQEFISCPGSNGPAEYEYNMMVRARISDSSQQDSGIDLKDHDLDNLFKSRNEYIDTWNNLDHLISERLTADTINCFGIGGWEALFAAFAPECSGKIHQYIVDNPVTAEFNGKPVTDSQLADKANPVLLAINPHFQDFVKAKLEGMGYSEIILWNDLISS